MIKLHFLQKFKKLKYIFFLLQIHESVYSREQKKKSADNFRCLEINSSDLCYV